MARKANSIRTASKITREFFEVMKASGAYREVVAKRAGINVNTFYHWSRVTLLPASSTWRPP
jgi:hypothetical protein